MAKTTIAQLEAALAELTDTVRTLNERLNKASEAFKTQRAEIAALKAELATHAAARPVTRVQTRGEPNPWFIALKQLREERGLAPEAWVDRNEVIARMEQNAVQH